ncbi:MAG: PCMD domain-containing protein, partial [Bacteroidaceae bacterium]|nr:PCMD domain-containing protein [Bacteroidaceae bacterium]
PDPSNYPSASCEGYSGRGVQLKTLSTGLFGQMSSKPIAAGNLFLGQFNLTKAMSAPLKSTEFGIKFTKKPLYVTGYYKFTSGGEAVDHNTKQVVSPKDQGTIYAVFFKNKDKNKNLVVLTGEDVKTNENIVAISSLTIDDDSNSNWKQFKLDLTNTKEPIDKNLLMRGGYSLTIVASSSIQGDKFIGAIGSTLCIDEIKIECE